MAKSQKHAGRTPGQSAAIVGALIALLVVVVTGGCLCWALLRGITGATGVLGDAGLKDSEFEGIVLRVAYSPEKEILFTHLVDGFNQMGRESADGRSMRVQPVRMDPDEMLRAASTGEFQAISPDSSVWLHQLDQQYAEEVADPAAFLVGQTRHYAISPVVIAMWEDAALELGWPETAIGWNSLVNHAIADPDFRWSHPSTASASGLLATLAEFYAAAGVTRGLTPEDLQQPETIARLQEMEATVSYYGEGEWAIAQQVNERGRDYVDAFVAQEQLVVWLNEQGHDLVAIYPVEGSLWEDHPLALLELPSLTSEQRLAFEEFAAFLESPEAQRQVMSHGYRPVDLSLDLAMENSPLTAENGVDPDQPRTTLQLPGAQVIDQVRNVWWVIKRKTNVYLVVDTSGSMDGEKLRNVKEALQVFVNQIEGAEERVGLIEFWGDVEILVPLDRLGDNRPELQAAIGGLEAGGDTALLDGVTVAYKQLRRLNDPDRINAIVVMTDGQENASHISITDLTSKLRRENQSGARVVIFAIAYGEDADYDMLQQLADSTGGQARAGTVETIRGLYKILSTYF